MFQIRETDGSLSVFHIRRTRCYVFLDGDKIKIEFNVATGHERIWEPHAGRWLDAYEFALINHTS
jgi:hypothetical protein